MKNMICYTDLSIGTVMNLKVLIFKKKITYLKMYI